MPPEVQRRTTIGPSAPALEAGRPRTSERYLRCASRGRGEARTTGEEDAMEGKVIRPRLNHYGLITGQLAEMKAWYETVIIRSRMFHRRSLNVPPCPSAVVPHLRGHVCLRTLSG